MLEVATGIRTNTELCYAGYCAGTAEFAWAFLSNLFSSTFYYSNLKFAKKTASVNGWI